MSSTTSPTPPQLKAGQVLRNDRSGRYWQVLRVSRDPRSGSPIARTRLLGGNRRVGWLHADAIGHGWRVEHPDARVIGCGRCSACEDGMVGSCRAPSPLAPPPRGSLPNALRAIAAKQEVERG